MEVTVKVAEPFALANPGLECALNLVNHHVSLLEVNCGGLIGGKPPLNRVMLEAEKKVNHVNHHVSLFKVSCGDLSEVSPH